MLPASPPPSVSSVSLLPHNGSKLMVSRPSLEKSVVETMTFVLKLFTTPCATCNRVVSGLVLSGGQLVHGGARESP